MNKTHQIPSRGIRLRAALCYWAGLAGLGGVPLWVVLVLKVGNRELDSLVSINLVLLLGIGLTAFSGWPITALIRYRVRSAHPYLHHHGRRALQFWRLVTLLLMGLFVTTTTVVIPACAEVADYYTTPPAEYIFSWVVWWLLLETTFAMLMIVLVVLGLSIRAYFRPR